MSRARWASSKTIEGVWDGAQTSYVLEEYQEEDLDLTDDALDSPSILADLKLVGVPNIGIIATEAEEEAPVMEGMEPEPDNTKEVSIIIKRKKRRNP